MKLTLDSPLREGVSFSFTRENLAVAPPHLQRLLMIPGVRSVYQVADFLALERQPQADWQAILAAAHEALDATPADVPPAEPPGKVNALLQLFRGLPMQIKLLSGTQEVRVALPPRFKMAAMQAAETSADFLGERKWVSQGVRYGDMAEVGEAMAAEVDAAYPPERLEALLAAALAGGAAVPAEPAAEPLAPEAVAQRLTGADWRERYAALDRLDLAAPGALPVVEAALADENPSVRRLAAVYLGEIGGPEAVAHLCRALHDTSAAVRRAAGDCLSDLGDPAGMPGMIAALQDPSKLVRWRAARYLYEVGDASALPALLAALADPAFEVSLQARLAIERIEGGQGAVEPAWKQMIREWDRQ